MGTSSYLSQATVSHTHRVECVDLQVVSLRKLKRSNIWNGFNTLVTPFRLSQCLSCEYCELDEADSCLAMFPHAVRACMCVCVCIYTRVKSYFKLVWKDRSQHTKKKLDVDTCCFLCVGIKTAHIEQRFKICAILVCDRKMTLVHTLLCQIPTGRGGVWSQCKPILQ